MQLKKSQVSMQFLVFISLIFVFFLMFLVGFMDHYKDVKNSRERVAIKDIALKIHDEIAIAHNMKTGYQRTFILSNTTNTGFEYNISLVNNVVIIYAGEVDYSIEVLPVSGELITGSNLIRKKGDEVCIGSAC